MRWLPGVKVVEAPDRYHTGYKPGVVKPVEAFILHYTGSTSPSGTRRWLTLEDDVFVSCHFMIDREGGITQMIALDERGAHAGGASSKLFGRGNVNGRTIGIELMNVGPLIDGPADVRTLAGKPWDGPVGVAQERHMNRRSAAVEKGKLRYDHDRWEPYSWKQVQALEGLLNQLYPFFPKVSQDRQKRVLGHEDVDPTRKTDPGPFFPWSRVYAV